MSTDPSERNAEIWSTRVQRELLALTTDNADVESTAEVRSMLPPFCSVQSHVLDIAQGTCIVNFAVEIATPDNETTVVVVSLDASLPHGADGNVLHESAPAYPFIEPMAMLQSGQESFPEGSTIQNGDMIPMDLDWTPSLHLTDAIMNLSLKIKESILQKEPFYPAVQEPDPMEEVAKGAQRIKASISKASTSLSKAFSPKNKQAPAATSGRVKPMLRKKQITVPGDVRIGDEINLLEEPWVDAHGVYSCKAIRRPEFVEAAMAQAGEKKEKEAFSSPTAMFRSFTQSARSVLEEAFIMITETHIVEMKASKLNLSTGTVVFCIPIEMMAKLKFRRQESLSLFFKTAPDDPLIYMCPDSGDAVHQIQAVLKRHGVKGKHTNAAAHRAIAEALSLVQEIQTKELALKHDPTVERVNEIMDLYRQAAERFEVAGDIRHEEVVTHMRKFLALPLTASILDGSYTKPEAQTMPKSPSKGDVPEGEVLERSPAMLAEDDTDDDHLKEREKENDKLFEENMDNILREAQEDLQQLKVDGDGNDVETGTPSADSAESGIADLSADLNAMMKEADEELAALMST